MIEYGCERFTLHPRSRWRWWVWIDEPNVQVTAKGMIRYRFARGGQAEDEVQARMRVEAARQDAERELAWFRHRASHALGPRGELIPIGGEAQLLEDGVTDATKNDLGGDTAQVGTPSSSSRRLGLGSGL